VTVAAYDRRGEAHLWLLLEEALVEARYVANAAHAAGASGSAAIAEVEEVRRAFEGVASALADVGAVARPLARHIVSELHVALTVRGLLGDESRLTWSDPPPLATTETPVRQRGDGWLESTIEQHLDLIVDLPPTHDVGGRVLANLAPRVRALRAVGSIRSGRRLDDLAATLAVTGYAAPGSAPEKGEVDKGWLSFLEARPRLLTQADQPTVSRTIGSELGVVEGAAVTLRALSWSTDVLQVDVAVPPHLSGMRWLASAYDDSGQLHLGQPGFRAGPDGVSFGLRPGVRDTVRTLSLRVTYGATRLDEQVTL
jgi:hypothetical protein